MTIGSANYSGAQEHELLIWDFPSWPSALPVVLPLPNLRLALSSKDARTAQRVGLNRHPARRGLR